MKRKSLLTLMMSLMVVAASADVAVNETNFPDANFRNWILEQKYGRDRVLTDAEIAGVTRIDVSSKGIKSLQGIGVFTKLQYLNCDNCLLTSLDVSKNTALTYLSCSYNQLTSLDVSNNTVLEYIGCGINRLTSLDVSKNTALTELHCGETQLTSLDVSNNTALTRLSCHRNQLTSLDVSKNTALTWLFCNGNQLTSLDVSGCTTLAELSCSWNKLTSLDVSKNTGLTWLECYSNQIKGTAMDALVESLPTVSGTMQVIYNENEGNVMTTMQVAAAKTKGWNPRYTINGGEWLTYAGSEPEVLKCATPMITYPEGKLILKCATENVKYVCNLGFETDESVSLPSKVKISIYATKDGYEPSDTLTQEIDTRLLLGKVGDVNGDGEIGMPDVMFIVNYILNGKFPEK